MNSQKHITKLDLPIKEVTGYLEGLLETLGDLVEIDGLETKIMISDLIKMYSNIDQNCKQGVFSKDVSIKRGSRVFWKDGRKGVIYTVPTDDIVSYSARILMCNAEVEVTSEIEIYDENTGDILRSGVDPKGKFICFIERISAREKRYDFGLLHQANLRLITNSGSDIKLGDIITFKEKKYDVVDVDDITEGLIVLQLSGVGGK